MTMIVWQGPSEIDSSPIVLLATFASGNSKTGKMTQTHIVRADMRPVDAIDQGADAAICGDCPHRSARSCYVHPIIRRGWGTAVAWQQFTDGKAEPYDVSRFAGRALRMGTYGDPAAVPVRIWRELIAAAGQAGHTGYTHQWRWCDPELAQWVMASCDSVADELSARALGWDTFTVHPVGTARPAGLKPCPASAEAGRKLQCESCLRCGGTSTGRRGNRVGIEAHGGGARKFVGSSLPLAVVR